MYCRFVMLFADYVSPLHAFKPFVTIVHFQDKINGRKEEPHLTRTQQQPAILRVLVPRAADLFCKYALVQIIDFRVVFCYGDACHVSLF